MLDVGLDSSKKERSKDLVELLDNGILIVVSSHLEPGVEVLAVSKQKKREVSSETRRVLDGEETNLEEKTSKSDDRRGRKSVSDRNFGPKEEERLTRQNEVEQRPKLLKVVLKRRSGDEESSSRVEDSDDLTEE